VALSPRALFLSNRPRNDSSYPCLRRLPLLRSRLLFRSKAEKRREESVWNCRTRLTNAHFSTSRLGFEAPLARSARRHRPLADRVQRTLQDMQVGRARKDAYLSFAARVDSPDLRSFIRALSRLTPMASPSEGPERTGPGNADEARQRAEDHAMKIPSRSLPVDLCISGRSYHPVGPGRSGHHGCVFLEESRQNHPRSPGLDPEPRPARQ